MKSIVTLSIYSLILSIVLLYLSIQLANVLFFVSAIVCIKTILAVLIFAAFEKKSKNNSQKVW